MSAANAPVIPDGTPWYRTQRAQWLGGGLLGVIVAQLILSGTSAFPKSWNIHLADPIKDFQSAIQRNRDTNFMVANVLRPIGSFINSFYEVIRDVLLDMPWFWLPLLVFLVIARSGKWAPAVGASLALVFVEVAGLHKTGMETIALMLICVVLSVAIGTPLGIWAGLNPTVERRMRPVLDALQSVPTTVYLVVAVLFFGIQQAPAAIATILFAVPPMVRITALGIQQVPTASVEAGHMFGSSRAQLLWKIQLPQAVKSLVTAVNQTIMMCLGLVVLAGLVGAGGLGAELIKVMRQRSPGVSFIIGLGVFAVAVGFDRLSRSLVDRQDVLPIAPKTYWGGAGAILLVGYVVGRAAGWAKVPWTFDRKIVEPIDDLVKWIRDNWGGQLQSINDFIVRDVVIRLRDWMGVSLAWPVLIALTLALAWWLKGWRFAAFCGAALVLVGLTGTWEWSLETLAQLIIAVFIAVLIAVPIGIFVGRRPRAAKVLEPFLDALQTVPSLVYAIPFVVIFAVGYVPGLLATVLYSVPPGIRLTALAIKQVSPETLEAATTFGATDRQRLWGVHVPLALRGIALGVNQVIMMAMSMVIIAGLVGGEGLGFQAQSALIKQDSGLGIEVGIAMLVMAIILDRLSEGAAERLDRTG